MNDVIKLHTISYQSGLLATPVLEAKAMQKPPPTGYNTNLIGAEKPVIKREQYLFGLEA